MFAGRDQDNEQDNDQDNDQDNYQNNDQYNDEVNDQDNDQYNDDQDNDQDNDNDYQDINISWLNSGSLCGHDDVVASEDNEEDGGSEKDAKLLDQGV